MDRLSSDLGRPDIEVERYGSAEDDRAIPLPQVPEALVVEAQTRLAIPERLLRLAELDVHYDSAHRALWTMMRPVGRPSFTPPMLGDFEAWQQLIGSHFGPGKVPLDYLVLGSRSPGVFCFGGDLDLFQQLIRQGNRTALAHYGYRCVEILVRNQAALDLPMLTVGLVQGQALGGGFEALLSFDVIIAERGSTFGLPEIMFGLFPGMGAHAYLSRKVGTALAERIIVSNKVYSAEEMYELGVVHELCEPGEGIAATRAYMARSSRRHSGLVAARRAMQVAAPVTLGELKAIVDIWADAALQLSDSDLKLMRRLAQTQARLHARAVA